MANKGVFLENPHTIRTLKTARSVDREWELRNAFLAALVRHAGDIVMDLWERRTLPPAEHLAQCEAWGRDFRLTNGGKEIPKWLLDHATLALHLWHRSEGFADLLGWTGFDLLGIYGPERNPEAGWVSEMWEAERKPGPRPDHVADCALVILHQCREMPLPTIAADRVSVWGATIETEYKDIGGTQHRRYRQPGNTFAHARWPALRLSLEALEQRIKRTKRVLGFASADGPGRPRREKRRSK